MYVNGFQLVEVSVAEWVKLYMGGHWNEMKEKASKGEEKKKGTQNIWLDTVSGRLL